ncbi:MFS transporter [Nocardioides convexus]|uniref:MFS transporter n=1 Tax=Nocardioides convexus TaxID=2712224 RepID=UPI002418375F|nr:MFS transporter [Nocardioides convexus]
MPSLDLSTSSLQWLISGYVLGYGGLLLVGGRTADLLGRRRVFLIALAVFAVASLLGGLVRLGPAAHRDPLHQGPRRRVHRADRAVHHHHELRRGSGAQQGAVDLHGLRRGRLLLRPALRWPDDRRRLALDLPAARPDRAARAGRRLGPGPPRRAGRGGRSRPARCADLRGRDAAARLHRRLRTRGRLGSARTVLSFVGVAALFAAFVAIERRIAHPLVRLGILRKASLVRASIVIVALAGSYFSLAVHRDPLPAGRPRLVAAAPALALLPIGLMVTTSAIFSDKAWWTASAPGRSSR